MAGELGVRLVKYGGMPSGDVLASHYDVRQAKRFSRRTGLQVLLNNSEVAERSDVVVLCVRPQQAEAVVAELAPLFLDGRRVLVSIAAGLLTRTLGKWIGSFQVAHLHPTSLVMVSNRHNPGLSLWTAHPRMKSNSQRGLIKIFEAALGEVLRVPEAELPKYIFLAGNTPAFLLRVIAAFVTAADLPTASGVYRAILNGIYQGLVMECRQPQEIIRRIATSQGVTEAGLQTLEGVYDIDTIARDVRNACIDRIRLLSASQ
jgi:pyrroline-5-carboxylate reductase